MKLFLEKVAGINTISGYGPDHVRIGPERHHANLVVMADAIHSGWASAGFDGLCEADFERLAALGVEIVLIGTGSRQRFPKPAFELAAVRRFDPPLSTAAGWAAAGLFIALLAATSAFLWHAHALAWPARTAAALGIVAGLWAVGALTTPRQAGADQNRPSAWVEGGTTPR